MPVPGAVFGDQDAVPVLGGKLVSGIELAMPSGATCAPRLSTGGVNSEHSLTHRELCILQVALVAVRIAEVLAELGDVIELVARHVVAQPVAGVLGEPVFSAARIDVAADAAAGRRAPRFSALPVLGSTRRICDTLVGGTPMLKGGPNEI